MKKQEKKKNMAIEDFDGMVNQIVRGLLVNDSTAAIVLPYVSTMTVEQALACLRCIAGLLILDDDDRKEICNKNLGSEAPFILMMVNEIDRIIEQKIETL